MTELGRESQNATHRHPLGKRVPTVHDRTGPDELFDRFLEYVKEKNLDLYPAQEEAILGLFSGHNIILNTPTGSGKSLVATALNFLSLSQGRRSIYTCPIKALVNEKFLALCAEFGADQVGMITGDATVNGSARILCCTAEILANFALASGEDPELHDIIMDEFHYYSDRDRGVAWQIPLLLLPKSRFLLMSATFGNTEPFEKYLSDLTRIKTVVVTSDDRPVPLNYEYRETLLHETIRDLMTKGKYPIYLVNFTQRECAEEAQNLMSEDLSSKEDKQKINAFLSGFKFSSPYGKDIQRLLRHGIGIHHAGLLPKYRLLVEQLSQRGLLKVICGTDTLGVGVNVPIRTVIFTKLCKFSGEKVAILSVRDFKQISGRAGRRGFDTEGTVVVQAPEHIVENLRQESKAAGDPKKIKKLVKKKPPEKGYVAWDIQTFNRLISSPAEPLNSSFKLSYGMLLQVLSRPTEGCKAMRRLIRDSHETPKTKLALKKSAFQMFRALHERQIIKFEYTLSSRDKQVIIDEELQTDFSLNQSLSLYLLDTLKVLDPTSSDYAVDVLTLVESIIENPDIILRRQLDKLSTLKMAELKAEGVEYEQRIEELQKLEYPKPNRDFIYDTYNRFSARHPWVGQENIRPKSIARDMYETFQSFDDYIKEFGLQRSEGLLLRYLSDVYKVLIQTVPETNRTEDLDILMEYIGSAIRGIDSSLVDEWEKIRAGGMLPSNHKKTEVPAFEEAYDITRNKKEFFVKIRNEVFRHVKFFATKNFGAAALALSNGEFEETPETIKSLEKWLESQWLDFYSESREIITDRRARSSTFFQLTELTDSSGWSVSQIIFDSEEINDWEIQFLIDKKKSIASNTVSLSISKIGPIGSFAT